MCVYVCVCFIHWGVLYVHSNMYVLLKTFKCGMFMGVGLCVGVCVSFKWGGMECMGDWVIQMCGSGSGAGCGRVW